MPPEDGKEEELQETGQEDDEVIYQLNNMLPFGQLEAISQNILAISVPFNFLTKPIPWWSNLYIINSINSIKYTFMWIRDCLIDDLVDDWKFHNNDKSKASQYWNYFEPLHGRLNT